MVLIVPLFERRAAGLYHNSAVVIERDGTQLGHYRKMHIPDDPLFYEKFYFTPGDLGFHCVDTSVGRIGVLICWDQWFPEAARLLALDGAELLFYPTAIGYLDGETDEENAAMRESWLTVQRGHAIANGVFVCAANRVGREGSLRFWGSSFVADPRGQLIAQADDSSEHGARGRSAISRASRRSGAAGRSCAIGASTPTASCSRASAASMSARLRMPAEWEPHAATWLAWPHAVTTWPGCLEEAEREFEFLVRTLARFERVELVVQSEAHRARIAARLGALARDGAVRLHVIPDRRRVDARHRPDLRARRARAWSRSTGSSTPGAASTRPGIATTPSPRRSRRSSASRASGRASCSRAARSRSTARARCSRPSRRCSIPSAIPASTCARSTRSRSSCSACARRSGSATGSRATTPTATSTTSRASRRPGRVVCAREPDPRDPNHAPLEDCIARLRAARDAAGRALEVIDLPMPPPVLAGEDRLPASYANFYIANGAVLVPVFGAPADERALAVLRPAAFPGREARRRLLARARARAGAVHCLYATAAALT